MWESPISVPAQLYSAHTKLIAYTFIVSCIVAVSLGYYALPVVASNSSSSNGDFNAIKRFRVESIDQYGNKFALVPKLIAISIGPVEEGNWTCYYYNFVRVDGQGVGDYGDVMAFMKLWDARNVSNRGYIQYELSRVSWGRLEIYIDDNLIVNMPLICEGHDSPSPSYIDGRLD